MRFYKFLSDKFKGLTPYSHFAIKLGFYIMGCFYVVAAVAKYIAPLVPNYINAMIIYRGALEAAPASLASGVCAGLLCDLIASHFQSQK